MNIILFKTIVLNSGNLNKLEHIYKLINKYRYDYKLPFMFQFMEKLNYLALVTCEQLDDHNHLRVINRFKENTILN